MRAIFSGSISFGLVNIPIKIYPATEDKQIEFHNVCSTCNTPLQYKRWCPKCEKEVAWSDIKKGYKITKEKWVILEKEDLKKLQPIATKNLEIVEFVDLAQIDPIFYEKSYYVVPNEGGEKAFSLFVDALRIANKAAIGKIIMREKQYLVALRAFKKGIVMHLLHYIGEIRDIEKLPELERLIVVSKEELKLAETLINSLTKSEFKAEKFVDAYTEAVKKLIRTKAEGKEFEIEKAEEKVEAARSLMEALKASVEVVTKKKKKLRK